MIKVCFGKGFPWAGLRTREHRDRSALLCPGDGRFSVASGGGLSSRFEKT